MNYVVKRFGFHPTRGFVSLFIIVAVLVGAAFWIGPFRPLPARLQLLALGGDGRFHDVADIPSAWADTLPPASEATARFPLILAVHNAGSRSARPTRLSLNLPGRYRITNTQGAPLPFFRVMGNPLVRYEIPIRAPAIEPQHLPTIIAGLDTLWLEPVVPTIYCQALSDSVPEFVSAPPFDARLLSRVRVFYSFSSSTIHQRQAGLLTLQVDPELVKRDPAPEPPVYETEVIRPQAPRPEMSELKQVGTRVTWCGDPGQPLEIQDVLWQTPAGGRFFVLYNGGEPRKYLFDLDRDSIVELEMWDQDNDGRFESRRPARFAIPAFLMPYREAVTDTAAGESLGGFEVDTVASTPQWLQLFYDTTAGPTRFAPKPTGTAPTTAPTAAPAVRETLPAARESVPAPRPSVPTVLPSVQVDSQWLKMFNNTDAGPLRFSGVIKKPPPPRPVRKEPKLLGVPVDEYRKQKRVNRDTLPAR